MNEFFGILMVTYIISTIHYTNSKSCLEFKNNVTWTRHFHVDNRTLPIIIDVTNRKSHRIISFILKILIIERLRYKNVTFNEIPWLSPSETMQRLHKRKNSSLPNAHINLELWQPPGFNVEAWVNKGLVLDCGPLGPIARRGIFIPTKTVDIFFKQYNESIDHWRIFDYKPNSWNYSDFYYWLTVNKSWITVDNFSPKNVQNVPIILIDNINLKKPLKQLFSSVFNPKFSRVILMTNTSGSLKQTIDDWIRHTDLHSDLAIKSPLYFYDWYPNVVTVNGHFNRVLFPDCYEMKDNPLCDFEINQMSKMVWSKLKSHATLVYQLVSQFKISESHLIELLKKVTHDNVSDDFLFDIACHWLKENKWSSWVEGWDKKQKLVVPGLYALYGKWVPQYLINTSYNEVKNLNHKYFNNTCYELVLDIRNLSCVEDLVLKEYLQYSSSHNDSATVIAFLATVCSDSLESTLKVSTFQNRILVTSTADSPNFGNVSQYKYFFRTIPSMLLQKTLLLCVFREWKWKQIVMLRKDSMFFDSEFFESSGIKVLEDPKFDDSILTYALAYQTLKRIRDKKNGRIFLVEYFAEATRVIMCAAFKLGMILENGYVWFLNPWMNDNWNRQKTDNCTAEEIINSTNRYFVMVHRGLAYKDYRTSDTGVIDGTFEESHRNPFAIFTAEAIGKIGEAIARLLEENPSALSILQTDEVAKKFISYISSSNQSEKRTSNVIKGHWLLLANIEKTKVPVFQWNVPSNVLEKNLTAYINYPITQTLSKEFRNKLWTSRNNYEPPSDGSINDTNSECVFGLNKLYGLSCSATILVFNAIILAPILFVIVLCFLFFFRRLRKTQEEEGIRKPFEFLCQELSDLDISGKDVVINRTVGKGNFGIVYGGEARQDNQWVLVAIKAISKKLDYRYKYEFLSEAKLMSNLNHENIVKLVGISLNPNSEMIYLIMEHVTGGDLKKFLIKRRVKAKEDPNNEKINPKSLTKFARDIASGLCYLHINRYLHRDVACRNCLVNADNGIKVGDFGLARRITKFNRRGGTGYYRFSGLGAMPIRWLPPESLQFGIYSISTDVWSFGVTLYEIVTFGIFPFGGFEHEEVVDKVKRGHFTVASFLPEEFRKNKIYGIINKCCSYNPSDRFKSMQEIIDIFDQDPECVVPLLSDNPPNLPNSGMSYHSNILMSEPSNSSHKKMALKIPKDHQPSFSEIPFSPVDSQSPDFTSSYIHNAAFYNAFVGLKPSELTKSTTQNLDRHIPVKSQSVEYIHLANSNNEFSLANHTTNSNNGDLEVDLGYVTYKTAEDSNSNNNSNTTVENLSNNRSSNSPTSKLPSNYLTATDKIDQSNDVKAKLVTNHSCSLDLSTDTGCSDIDCVTDNNNKQSLAPLINNNDCSINVA